MLLIPSEKLPHEEVAKRHNLIREKLGNNFNDDFYLDEEEEIKELIILYKKGIFLDVLDFYMFISSIEPLKFYKLMLVLTQNNKHNRQVFIDEWGTLEDKRSAINQVLK